MIIQISGKDKDMNISLPTRMLFSKTVLRLIRFAANRRISESSVKIPPEAVGAIYAELERVKARYGTWTLVEVESEGKDTVKIIL